MFFGGGRGRSAGPRKGPSLNHPLKVSLEDLYNGKSVKLAINRKVIVGESKQCTKCDGHGVVMEMRQIGPGMITQMQRPCDACQGQGYQAETKNERKVVEVHVEKGAHNNQKVRGGGDDDNSVKDDDRSTIVLRLQTMLTNFLYCLCLSCKPDIVQGHGRRGAGSRNWRREFHCARERT